MPFTETSPGVYTYNGVVYHEVDCGGGGNCLFLSLAYLLRFYNLDALATHSTVRGYSAAILQQWVAGFPDWVDEQEFEQPGLVHAQAMAGSGEWGTKTAALAVVAHYNTINLTILGPDEPDDVFVADNLSGGGGRTRLYLFFSGYNHYRALVPAGAIHRVPDGMRVDKASEPKLSKELFASLKTVGSSGAKTNTYSASAGSFLEIHHINVGQGDSTLIYVKDALQAIVKSLLIDTGENADAVSNYLDTRIKYGDFRPLDMMILSHWDKDHMGAAADIIKAGKYTQKNLRIIDVGDPENEDRDAEMFLKDFGKYKGRELPSLYKPLVDDCLGFTLTCYMFNGLARSGSDEENVLSLQDWETYPISGFFGKSISKQIIQARNQCFPQEKNHRSIALVVWFHGFTYFTAGDLSHFYEESVAGALQSNYGHVCAWKLGHHGAAEASSPKTLLSLRPRFGVVSCGSDNDYGHPSGAAIEHLDGLNKIAPCDFYVTTKIPLQASGLKFQPGQITGIGSALDAQGDILIRVRSADLDKHRFEVYSNSNPKGKEFVCGEREFSKSDKILKSKRKSVRLVSEQDKLNKKKRQLDRISEILPTVEETVKANISDESWLQDGGVIKAMENLANQIRKLHGEECEEETIKRIVNAKFEGRKIKNAADIVRALKRVI